MRMDTLLTHELGWFEHINHPDTARIPSSATLRLEYFCVALLYFLHIYSKWFATRRSWSSVAGVLIGTSVSAC